MGFGEVCVGGVRRAAELLEIVERQGDGALLRAGDERVGDAVEDVGEGRSGVRGCVQHLELRTAEARESHAHEPHVPLALRKEAHAHSVSTKGGTLERCGDRAGDEVVRALVAAFAPHRDLAVGLLRDHSGEGVGGAQRELARQGRAAHMHREEVTVGRRVLGEREAVVAVEREGDVVLLARETPHCVARLRIPAVTRLEQRGDLRHAPQGWGRSVVQENGDVDDGLRRVVDGQRLGRL